MTGLMHDDPYLRRFWPMCPKAVIDVMETRVGPAALGNHDPCATNAILPEACKCSWYVEATPSERYQFHCLVGHVVRVARDYDVARRHGRPVMLRSKHGPHITFTVQIPRRAPS
jgi:hypothetical protein